MLLVFVNFEKILSDSVIKFNNNNITIRYLEKLHAKILEQIKYCDLYSRAILDAIDYIVLSVNYKN